VCIITPSLRAANTGNWHTAARWARFLRPRCRVRVLDAWDGWPCEALIALHARRSAPSIDAFARAHPARPLIVVLTGTDLYRDLATDESARRSLDLATAIVALQERAPDELPPRWRRKTTVIYQSAPALAPLPRPKRHFEVLVAGHLRPEKDPALAMRLAEALAADSPVRIVHAGAALDAALGKQAQRTARRNPRYAWIGALSRGQARARMRRAHLLLHPSLMEGGAQVIVEAVSGGTPVVASDCAGNVGMLGAGYAGLFPVGDAAAAAALVERAARDGTFYRQLQRQCKKRAALFDPSRERRALDALVHNSLHMNTRKPR
jgi:putative glycosyltransferase (TIGR04348 family)